MSWARRTAWNILIQVDRSREDPRRLLDIAFEKAPEEDRRDLALASNLVFSVLRWRLRIDWGLDRISRIPMAKCAPEVRNALRMGAAQLFILDRIPPHAAVNETIRLLEPSHPKRVLGFANAVLRTLARKGPSLWVELEGEPLPRRLSVLHSHPEWLVRRWMERMDERTLIRILEHNNREPPCVVRVNTLRKTRSAVRRIWEDLGVTAGETAYAPDGLVLHGLEGPVHRWRPWQEGDVEVQDEGAQLLSHVAAPRPGMRVLDLCAGRGGKTGHLAQLMEDRGEILAVDLNPEKVRLLCENLIRLGVRSAVPLRADAARLHPEDTGGLFDLVMVDAPCTGLGTLRRKIDLRWNRRESDIQRMVEVQRALLSAATRLTRPGGILVFATCSLEPEENERNVLWFLAAHPEFELRSAAETLPLGLHRFCDQEGFFRTTPAAWDTDGFFAARLRKKPLPGTSRR